MVITRHFDTPDQVLVQVENKLGPVRVHTLTQPATEVEISARGADADAVLAATRVEQAQIDGWDRIEIEIPGWGPQRRVGRRHGLEVSVVVGAPEGAAIEISTSSGDINAEGRFGPARLDTATGEVRLDHADGDVRVRSASGDVHVGSVAGEATIATASGRVDCRALEGGSHIETASGDVTVSRAAERFTVRTASGGVTAGDLDGRCVLRTASGDQRIRRLIAGRVSSDTVSGEITVGIARGSMVSVDAQSVSGALGSEDRPTPGARPRRPGPGDQIHGEQSHGEQGPGEQSHGEQSPADHSPQRVDLRVRTVSGDLHVERAAG